MTQPDELPGFAVPVRRSVVGGVTVFSAPADGATSATLSFRAGMIDETLTTSGITHLVEHLAMPAHSRHAFEVNARVEGVRTLFWGHGEEQEVAGFLRGICTALRSLPLERFEAERRILTTESATSDASAYSVLAGTRFGARGLGLANWSEPGLQRMSPGDAAGWAAERFVAANAVVWTTGAPESLELDLATGSAIPSPPLEQMPFSPPAYAEWGRGGIAFSALTGRTLAARVAFELLRDRLFDVLRYELGVSYGVSLSYDPLSAEYAHVLVVADVHHEHEEPALERILATIDGFTADGPSEEELGRYRDVMRRSLRDPTQVRGWLDYLAMAQLLGQPIESNEAMIGEMETLVPADVAAATAALKSNLLFCLPPGLGEDTPLNAMPAWHDAPVRGREFKPRLQGWHTPQWTAVTAGAEGVTLRDTAGTATILVEDAVGVFRWQNRRRVIVRKDGKTLTLSDGVHWRGGRDLMRLIDDAYPEHLVFEQDEMLPAPSRKRLPYIALIAVGIFVAGMTSAAVQGLGASENIGASVAVLVLCTILAARWLGPHREAAGEDGAWLRSAIHKLRFSKRRS